MLSLDVRPAVVDKILQSTNIFQDLVRASRSPGTLAYFPSAYGVIGRLDKRARKLETYLGTRNDGRAQGGGVNFQDPREFLKLAILFGEELVRFISDLGKFQEIDIQNQLSDEDREKLERDKNPQIQSVQENKKPKNQLILENHRRGRGVHPVMHDQWWYADEEG